MAQFDGHDQLAWGIVATAPTTPAVPTNAATDGLNPTLGSGEGAKFDTAKMPYNARVGPADVSTWTKANTEVVRVTGKSGDTLTLSARRQEGSAGRAMAVGDRIIATDTGKVWDDVELPAANASPALPSVQAYGHSWIFGTGSPASKYGFVQEFARETGVNYDGQALSGGVVTGIASSGGVGAIMQNPDFATDLVRGPYATPGGPKVCMIGYNDYPIYQGLTGGNGQVENALTVAFSRLLAARVVKAAKVGAAGIGIANESVDVTYNGSWSPTADVTASEGLGYTGTVTVNDSVDIALDADYNGEAITIFFPIIGAVCRFTGEVRLDPAGANTLLASQDTTQWQLNLISAGINASVQCVRIPAGTISAGAHTVRWKITAITGGNAGTFGGLIIEGTAPLLVPLFPPQPSTPSVVAQRTWDNARNVAVAANFPTAVTVDLAPWVSPNYGGGSEAADAQYWSLVALGHLNVRGNNRGAQALLEAIKRLALSKFAAMSIYQPSARALARWMKPGQGSVLSANRGVWENFDREDAAATLALTSAKIYACGIATLPAGKPSTGLGLLATVAGTLTARWVGLCRVSDRVVIAVSANAATPFTVGQTPQSWLRPFIPPDDVDVYPIFGVVYSVAPTLASKAVNATQSQLAPVKNGVSTTAASATPPTAEVLAATGLTPVTGTQLGVFTTTIASVPHATLLG